MTGSVEEVLREVFENGTIARDADPIGVWYVTGARHAPDMTVTSRTVTALWRDAAGVMNSQSFEVAPRDDVGAGLTLRPSQDTAARFGRELAELLRAVGPEWEASRPTTLTTSAARHPIQNDSASFFDGLAIAERALRPGLERTVAPWVATLAPLGLSFVRDTPWARDLVGAAWPSLEVGMPLARAVGRWPGFRKLLASIHAADGEAFRAMLDEGRLEAAMADALGARGLPRHLVAATARCEAHLRRTSEGAVPSSLATLEREHRMSRTDLPEAVVRSTEGFPSSWIPRDDAQWTAFADLADCVSAARDWIDAPAHLAKLVPSGGDWVGHRARLVAAAGVPSPAWLERAVVDVDDMCRAYAQQVLLPAVDVTDFVIHRVDAHVYLGAARHMLTSGRSLARILELSAAYHRSEARMREALSETPGAPSRDDAWPPWLPSHRDVDVDVVVLADAASLRAEGGRGPDLDGVAGLSNCVGAYADRCLDGACRIVSIRSLGPDGAWSRSSVAELVPDPSAPSGLSVEQHVGPLNGPAPAACAEVLGRYLGMVASGDLTLAPDAWTSEPRTGSDEIATSCGHDRRNPDVRALVRASWDRFVPRPLRGLGDDVLAEMAETFTDAAWSPEPVGVDRAAPAVTR